MAESVDGDIRISVGFDTTPIERKVSGLKQTFSNLGRSISDSMSLGEKAASKVVNASDKASQAINKQSGAMSAFEIRTMKATEAVRKQEAIVMDLQNKLSAYINQSATPKFIQQGEKDLDRYKTKIEALEAQILKVNTEAIGIDQSKVTVNGSDWLPPEKEARLAELKGQFISLTGDLERLRAEARELYTAMQQIRMNPEASAEAQALGLKLGDASGKLDILRMQESLLANQGEATASSQAHLGNEVQKVGNKFGYVAQGFKKVQATLAKGIGNVTGSIDKAQKGISRLINRFKNLVLAAFVFNVLSRALRELGTTFMGLLKQDDEISAMFSRIKGNLYTAFAPIYNYVLPLIRTLVSWIETLTSAFAQLVAMLTGQSIEASIDQGEALKDEVDAIKDVGGAAKKASKQLASFDEVNTLNTKDQSGGGSGSGTKTIFEPKEVNLDWLKRLRDLLPQIDFNPLKESLFNLWEALKPFGAFVWQGLKDLWNLYLVPLATYTIETFLPTFFNDLADSLGRIDWTTLNVALANMWIALEPLTEDLGNGLLTFFREVIYPIGEWFLNKALPTGIDLFTTAITNLRAIFIKLQPSLKKIGEILKEVFTFIGDFVIHIMESFQESWNELGDWFEEHGDSINTIVTFLGDGLRLLWAILSPIITLLWDDFVGVLTFIIDLLGIGIDIIAGFINVIKGLITGIMTGDWSDLGDALYTLGEDIVMGLVDGIMSMGETMKKASEDFWGAVIQNVKDLFGIASPSTVFFEIGENIVWGVIKAIMGMLETIKKTFQSMWDEIINVFSTAFDAFYTVGSNMGQGIIGAIDGAIENIKKAFQNVWEGIKSVFSTVGTWFGETFGNAWEKVKEVFNSGGEIFDGIKEGIETTFKSIVNSLIDGINSVVSVPFKGINSALKTLRDFSILDQEPFSFLPTISIPQIPKLAQGAVLPANNPFLALVGDQKQGTNIEAPLSVIQDAIRQALSEMKEGDITIPIYIGNKMIEEIVITALERKKYRSGGY